MIPVTPRTTEHLCAWCKEYQFNGTVPQPKNVRFSIGVYQISQGMSWPIGAPVRWQSFCSAAMHFIMCGYAHDIEMLTGFPETLAEMPSDFIGWETLMLRIGKAQQQVVYALHSSANSTRASRYNPNTLHLLLHSAVEACFSFTPPEYREKGCFDEMHILTGDLPAKSTRST